jgi:nucleotide-binding universal stress UspA family protein
MYRFDSILIAVDDSEPSAWAVDAGAALAQQLGAHVVLVHVVNRAQAFVGEFGTPLPEVLSDLRKQGEILLDNAHDRIPPCVAVERVLREGKPSAEICEAARVWGAKLVVLGTHGRGRLARFLVGSTAEGVIREAPCPVLALREPVAPLVEPPVESASLEEHGAAASR